MRATYRLVRLAGCLALILVGVSLAAEDEQVNKDMTAGEEAGKGRDYPEAIRYFTRALEKDPLNSNAYADVTASPDEDETDEN